MSDDDLLLRAQGRIGTTLGGKYRIDSVLGVGGMAVVFAATHRNQRRVAIKVLHPEISLHREVRERFLREGYAANTVDHPGAVAVLDDDVGEDGAAFLVMERLEGDEVDRISQRRGGRLPVQVVMAIADGLLAVLQAAHAKSVIHRDIKPANLYVTQDGSLKVLDFGIARVRDAASGGATATKTGMMLGTPAFMSPEQALSKSSEIDGRSDLWSVGATMFELLSGSLVHQGESTSMLIVQAATQPARPLAVALPDVNPRLAAIVDRALAFDKAARWPDAAAMRAAVRAAYLEMFGVRVGREPLEELFAESVGNASTVYAPSAASAGDPTMAPSAALASPALTAPGAHAPPSSIPGAAPPAQVAAQVTAQVTALAGVSTLPGIPGAEATAPPAQDRRKSPLLLAGLLLGAVVVVGGGVGLMARRASSARAEGPAVPSSELTGTAVASAAPPSSEEPPVVQPAPEQPTADPTAMQSAEAPSTSAPAPRSTPKPAPAATSATHPATTPTPAPAPTPPKPAYVPPPAMCKAQCSDTARACKATCKSQFHFGHDRHQCLVSCETTERDCRSHAPC